MSIELLHARRPRDSERRTRGVKGQGDLYAAGGDLQSRRASCVPCRQSGWAPSAPSAPPRRRRRWPGNDHVRQPSQPDVMLTPLKREDGGGLNVKTSRAERQGFEPWEPVSQLNSLAVSPIRPLSHLSSVNSLAARGSRNNTRKYRLTRYFFGCGAVADDSPVTRSTPSRACYSALAWRAITRCSHSC